MLTKHNKMNGLSWFVLFLALTEGGWLAFDGAHALITGDYVTPQSGEHAGQLGPWAGVVSALGIEPRSILMQSIHLLLGLTWLAVTVCFTLRIPWSRTAMVVCAVLGLWYLPFGTLLSIIQIMLLGLPALRIPAR